ncbi:MAG: PAS domain S-box protein [Acidimicrobiales bacterium]
MTLPIGTIPPNPKGSTGAGSATEDLMVGDIALDLAVVWAMLDAAPDASVLCDGAGQILFVNRQLESLFGYQRAELLGGPVEVLLPEPLRSGHQAHRQQFAARPSTRPMGQDRRLAGRRRDGTVFPVEVALSPLRIRSQDLALANIRDITDRLAAEAHVRYVQQLLDGTSDGVYVFAADSFHIEYANMGAALQSGYSRAELIDLTPEDLIMAEHDRFETVVRPLLQGHQQVVRYEDVLQHRDGSMIPIEVSLSYPVREDGQHRVVAVARDISERREADVERQRAETAMALAEERERVARDLHDTVIQELFAAGMTLEATLSRVPDEIGQQRISSVVDQIDQAIRHLRTSIFASRRPNSGSTSFVTAINALVAELNRILPQPAHTELIGPLDDMTWQFARTDMLASLRECLTNVARHAAAQHVEVVVRCDEHALSFEVRDDGKGIPAPMNTTGTTDTTTTGGNGLANIAARAARHGGTFTIIGRSPKGSVAYWSIPAAVHHGDTTQDPSTRMN